MLTLASKELLHLTISLKKKKPNYKAFVSIAFLPFLFSIKEDRPQLGFRPREKLALHLVTHPCPLERSVECAPFCLCARRLVGAVTHGVVFHECISKSCLDGTSASSPLADPHLPALQRTTPWDSCLLVRFSHSGQES